VAKSVLGQGATFVVTLLSHNIPNHVRDESARTRKRILCAEDDPDDRLLLTEAFNESGCVAALDFVSDGEELWITCFEGENTPNLDRLRFPA